MEAQDGSERQLWVGRRPIALDPPGSRQPNGHCLFATVGERRSHYGVLRRGLAARNAIAHGFRNQVVDAALFEQIRAAAKGLLATRKKGDNVDAFAKLLAENAGE